LDTAVQGQAGTLHLAGARSYHRGHTVNVHRSLRTECLLHCYRPLLSSGDAGAVNDKCRATRPADRGFILHSLGHHDYRFVLRL